eukprot:754827-Hanusia_phi.AAC.11
MYWDCSCRLRGGFVTNEKVYDWLDKGATQVIVEYRDSNMGFLDGVPKERITLAVKVKQGRVDLAVRKWFRSQGAISPFPAAALIEVRPQVVEAAKGLLEKGMMLNVMSPPTTDDVSILRVRVVTTHGLFLLDCLPRQPWDRDGTMTIPEVLSLIVSEREGDVASSQALKAVLVSDRPDGLIPTVVKVVGGRKVGSDDDQVVDEDMVTLGLCYSNLESLAEAFKRSVGVYWRSVLDRTNTLPSLGTDDRLGRQPDARLVDQGADFRSDASEGVRVTWRSSSRRCRNY